MAYLTKVTPNQLLVIEGHHGEHFTVTSNIPPPFFCCTGCKGQCQVHIVGIFQFYRRFQKCESKYVSQALIGSSTPVNYNSPICGFALTMSNWNQNTKVEVKATIDLVRDGDHRINLDVIAHVYSQPMNVQITTKPTEIKITTIATTVKDNDHRLHQCKSVNDPHMSTFDGQRYNMMKEGQFVLYKHKSLPFEVRALYHKCSKRSHASCNCAVAVKSGDDVITVTGCQGTTSGGHPGQGHGIGLIFQQLFGHHGNAHGHDKDELAKTPMTIQIYKNGELTPGTHIRRYGCGQKYEIELPTGMIVTVQQSWKPFINIWITASSVDFGNTEGLCGSYDGNTHNDLKPNVNSFSEHWKINGVGNFFYGVSVVSSNTVQSYTYCSCIENRNTVCTNGLGIIKCTNSRYDITTALVRQAKNPILTHGNGRRRRQAEEVTVDIPEDDNEFTYDEAKDECTKYITRSSATQACEPILSSNVSNQIENCADDYNATGNFNFSVDALSDIVVDCVQQAKAIKALNESGNTNVTEGGVDIPQDLDLDAIVKDAIVVACGDHGTPEDGVCRCDDGYSGEQCEVSKDTVPVVTSVPILCDISQTDDCMAARIFGINFVESDTLTCHYEYVEVSDSIKLTGETGKVPVARYVSINEVSCVLPKMKSARISISNNGISPSDDKSTHVVYNSLCHDCSVANDTTFSLVCTRTNANCVIGGVCYEEGVSRHGDRCQTCQAAANNEQWTQSQATECIAVPVTEAATGSKMERTQVIILAVVCAVFAAIILIGTCYLIKGKMNKNKPKEFGAYEVSGDDKLHREQFSAVDNQAYDAKL